MVRSRLVLELFASKLTGKNQVEKWQKIFTRLPTNERVGKERGPSLRRITDSSRILLSEKPSNEPVAPSLEKLQFPAALALFILYRGCEAPFIA